jgi:hypothetical protein
MKTEITTKYIAEDGTSFDSESDCLVYESNNIQGMYLYGPALEPIKFNIKPFFWFDVHFIKTTNMEAVNKLIELMNDVECPYDCYPLEPGIFHFNTLMEKWVDVNEMIEKYSQIKKRLDDTPLEEWVLSDCLNEKDLRLVVDRMGWEMSDFYQDGNLYHKILYPESDKDVFEIIMEQFC